MAQTPQDGDGRQQRSEQLARMPTLRPLFLHRPPAAMVRKSQPGSVAQTNNDDDEAVPFSALSFPVSFAVQVLHCSKKSLQYMEAAPYTRLMLQRSKQVGGMPILLILLTGVSHADRRTTHRCP
jgi:hypothetical protein